jgi:autotransporter-associated beta strand protein
MWKPGFYARLLVTLGAVLAMQSWAIGATATWTGGGGLANDNWSNSANWQNGYVPQSGDDVVFDSPTTGATLRSYNDLPAGTEFNSVTVTQNVSDCYLNGNSFALPDWRITGISGLRINGSSPLFHSFTNDSFHNGCQITYTNQGSAAGYPGSEMDLQNAITVTNSGGMNFLNNNIAGVVSSGSSPPLLPIFSLSAANNWTGPTNVPTAQLTLDFSQTWSPTNAIIDASSALTLGSTSPTTTPGAGIVNILGGLSGVSSQVFSSVIAGVGANQINVTAGSSTSTTLTAGGLGSILGGLFHVTEDTNAQIHFSTSPSLSDGIIGAWCTLGNDWATVNSSGNLVAYTNYLNESGTGTGFTYSAGVNIKVTGVSTGAGWGLLSPALNTVLDASGGTGTQAFTNAAGTITVDQYGGFMCNDIAANHQMLVQLGTFTGPAGGGEINLNVGAAPGTYNPVNLVFKSAIADPAGGKETVVKGGSGLYQAFGPSTYSGGTYIDQGTGEIINSASAMGTGPIFVQPGGQFWINVTATFANPIFAAGDGSADAAGQTYGAIKVQNFVNLFNNITLTGDARISSTGSSGTLSGPITGPHALWLGDGWSNTGISLSNTANAWTGGLFVDGGTTLTLNAANVLPNGTNYGDITLIGVSTLNNTVLNTNHYNEIFGGLNSSGVASDCDVESILGGSTSTVTVGGDNADGNFAGNILDYNSPTAGIGRIAFVKIGTGTQILSGSNTWSAGTTVTGGILQFASAGALPSSAAITVNNGATIKLSVSPSNTIASMDVEGTAMVDCTSGVTAFCQSVAGGGTCEKTDAGTFCVTTQNTCSGGVDIEGGTYCATNDSCLGATGVACTIDNATCQITTTCTTSRNYICEGNATMMCEDQSSNPCTVTCTGLISGPGTLVCTGGDLQCTQSIDPFGLDVIDHEFQLADNAGTSNIDQLQIGPPTGGPMIPANSKIAASASTPAAAPAPATLDLGNNTLIIHYSGASPIATIAGYLVSGYAGGAWNGPGIDSSAAAANPGYALGYADSADPGNPAGLAAGTIEVKYTLVGDADLNGTVNGIDFGILAANFNKTVTGWDQGDFDYNNIVNGLDFTALAANFNKAVSGGSVGASALSDPAIVAFAEANGLMADVPEPAAFGALAVTAAGILARRRRLL